MKLAYLLYRCFKCGDVLTALEIEKIWGEAEKDTTKTVAALCPCGSSKVTPTNLTPEEEKKYEHWWQWVRYFIGKRDRNTRIIDLYFQRVRGQELSEYYQEEK